MLEGHLSLFSHSPFSQLSPGPALVQLDQVDISIPIHNICKAIRPVLAILPPRRIPPRKNIPQIHLFLHLFVPNPVFGQKVQEATMGDHNDLSVAFVSVASAELMNEFQSLAGSLLDGCRAGAVDSLFAVPPLVHETEIDGIGVLGIGEFGGPANMRS